jgi:hypothetical protein
VDQRAHCPITVIRDEADGTAAHGGDPPAV